MGRSLFRGSATRSHGGMHVDARDHWEPTIAHSIGMNGNASTIMAARVRMETTKATRKRRRILGTSRKKLLRSTSFFVAPHSAKRSVSWRTGE